MSVLRIVSAIGAFALGVYPSLTLADTASTVPASERRIKFKVTIPGTTEYKVTEQDGGLVRTTFDLAPQGHTIGIVPLIGADAQTVVFTLFDVKEIAPGEEAVRFLERVEAEIGSQAAYSSRVSPPMYIEALEILAPPARAGAAAAPANSAACCGQGACQSAQSGQFGRIDIDGVKAIFGKCCVTCEHITVCGCMV